MSDYIIGERNRLNEEIKKIHRYNDVDSSALSRFRGMNASDVYVQKQVEKLSISIEKRSDDLEQLTERLGKLDVGELDDELFNNMQKNRNEAKEKGHATIKRKKEAKAVDAESAKKSKEFYQMERKGNREGKAWIYKSAERHFFKACDSVPDWMLRDLSKMPANEGYVWKNVYCFGNRPKRSDVFKVTEARKGMKFIHYWDSHTERKFKKEGRDEPVLISEKLRKKK